MAKKDGSSRFTIGDFLLRLLFALVLVLATYNPTSYSFIDWIMASINNGGLGAVHAFVGVVLMIGWVILFTATFNSLGSLGLGLGIAFIAALIWLLYDVGLLTGSSLDFYAWLALIGLSAILALGLCWAHLWRSLTGQLNVDEVDD